MRLRRARRSGPVQRRRLRQARGLARPDRGGRRRRAAATGAQPPRRRPAAARGARAPAAHGRGGASKPIPPVPARISPRRESSSATRCRSCASSRAGSIPPSSPTAASAAPSRRSPTARRCRWRSRTCPRSACPSRSRPRRTTSIAEAITNVAKHAEATHVAVSVRRDDGRVLVRGRRRRHRRRRPGAGSGLHGLADRVEALHGQLRVDSPRAAVRAWRRDPGRAELPLNAAGCGCPRPSLLPTPVWSSLLLLLGVPRQPVSRRGRLPEARRHGGHAQTGSTPETDIVGRVSRGPV